MRRLRLEVASWPRDTNLLANASDQLARDPRGKTRQSDIKKAALRHFAERGFEGATMTSLVTACGVTRHVMSYHFPNKATLFAAVLADCERIDRTRREPYVRQGGIAVLRGMVELVERDRLDPDLLKLLGTAMPFAHVAEHPARDFFQERQALTTAEVAAAITAAVKAGELQSDVDVGVAAVTLTGLVDGLRNRWLVEGDFDMAPPLRSAILALLTPRGRTAYLNCPSMSFWPASTAPLEPP